MRVELVNPESREFTRKGIRLESGEVVEIDRRVHRVIVLRTSPIRGGDYCGYICEQGYEGWDDAEPMWAIPQTSSNAMLICRGRAVDAAKSLGIKFYE